MFPGRRRRRQLRRFLWRRLPGASRVGHRLFLPALGRDKFRCRFSSSRELLRRLRGLRRPCAVAVWLALFPGPARNSGRWFWLRIRLVVCGRILRQRKLRTSWMRLFSSAKRCCRSSICSAIWVVNMLSDFGLGVIWGWRVWGWRVSRSNRTSNSPLMNADEH